jgi:DNA ligase (NAD+)
VAPVSIGGHRVERASLSNLDAIASLWGAEGARVGDLLVIARRGGIIPHIERVSARGKGVAIPIPSTCPSCTQPLTKTGPYLTCTNVQCSGTVLSAMSKYLTLMEVRYWGKSILEALITTHHINQTADLYSISLEVWNTLYPSRYIITIEVVVTSSLKSYSQRA